MITIPISAGELVDKVTILRLKSERITDLQKRVHVDAERTILEEELARLPQSSMLTSLIEKLTKVNENIWDAEEILRTDIDDTKFLTHSRMSHTANDERFRLKREINELLSSALVEEKSHQP